MGPPRSSKKRPQATRTHRCVQEISSWIPPTLASVTARTEILYTYRILPLALSGFPRVSRRTTIAMIMSAAMAMPTLSGVIKLGLGVGVGVVGGGGGAFFAANIP